MTLTGKTPITDASPTLPPTTSQAKAKKLRQKLLGGSLTLLAGSGLVGITNLVYNLVTARLLGPTGFAHVTAVYTLLMLASAITLSFQVVCAKYVASHESADDKAKIFNALHLRGWIAGVAIGFLGGLTTFSTFAADTIRELDFKNGQPLVGKPSSARLVLK